MNWFRENRFLGIFLISFGICALSAVWFLSEAKGNWDDASTQFHQTTAELNRLERLAPYPSAENLRKMKAHAEDYEAALARLKDELRIRGLPVPPMAPNEFQSHLRVAMNGIAEKARANRVKLPDKFYLGFDNFASALPNEAGGAPARTRAGADRVAPEYYARGTGGCLDLFPAGTVAGRKRGCHRRAWPCRHRSKTRCHSEAPRDATLLKRPFFQPPRRRERSSIRSREQLSNSSLFGSCTFETRRTKGRCASSQRTGPSISPRRRLLVLRVHREQNRPRWRR